MTHTPLVNDIPQRQNETRFLRLLQARSQIYDEAALYHKVQFSVAVLLPIIGAGVGLVLEDARPYVAAGSIIATAFDAAILDLVQRKKLEMAAKASEQFDCELLEMPWNDLLAGKQPDPETIEAAATAWQKGDERLRDWYPPNVGSVPIPLARAMCQRTNAWYDTDLRKKYVRFLRAAVWLVLLLAIAASIVAQMSVLDTATTLIAPAMPILVWCIREIHRHQYIVEGSATAQSEAENLCKQVAHAKYDDPSYAYQARRLQDAIYVRRSVSPLLFPFLYSLSRSGMEKRMRAGASEMLRRLRGSS